MVIVKEIRILGMRLKEFFFNPSEATLIPSPVPHDDLLHLDAYCHKYRENRGKLGRNLWGILVLERIKLREREREQREFRESVQQKLKDVQGSHRLDIEPSRKSESEEARRLHEHIIALAKTAELPERDVLRFTVPLTAMWNKFNPLRNNTAFQHWGVVVADFGKEVVDTVMRNRKELKKKKQGWGFGVVHELSRVGRQSAYRVYKWMSNAIKAGCKVLSVGKTKFKDDEILSKGMQTLKSYR